MIDTPQTILDARATASAGDSTHDLYDAHVSGMLSKRQAPNPIVFNTTKNNLLSAKY